MHFFFNLNKQYKTRAPFVRIAIVPSRSREIIIIIIILFTLGTSLHAFILVYTYMCTYTRTPSNFESTLLWLSETFRSFQPSSFSDCNEVGARCKTFTTLPYPYPFYLPSVVSSLFLPSWVATFSIICFYLLSALLWRKRRTALEAKRS